MSLKDVDRCSKFLQYVCNKMSDKSVFPDLIGRTTELIAVVDWVS